MKAYLINMHLLVPRSRSSAKVKAKYKGYISQKMAVSGAFGFDKHVFFQFRLFDIHCTIFFFFISAVSIFTIPGIALHRDPGMRSSSFNSSGMLDHRPLTLFHTILAFDDTEKEAFRNHCGKRRKYWFKRFFLFPQCFLSLEKQEFIF